MRILKKLFSSPRVTNPTDNIAYKTPILKSDQQNNFYLFKNPESERILNWAQPYIGISYSDSGNKTLDETKGIDCSGFMYNLYKELYNVDIGTYSHSQGKKGVEIGKGLSGVEKMKLAQPGDLLYFRHDPTSDTGSGASGGHVAAFLGKGNDGRYYILDSNTRQNKNGIAIRYLEDDQFKMLETGNAGIRRLTTDNKKIGGKLIPKKRYIKW